VLPADAKAYAVQPHAHYLLKKLRVTATPPGGKPSDLLLVNDWDMNWQDRYYYTEPVPLAKGTRLDMAAVFDNSADNPQNPTSPPKDIKWGLNSTDEMLNTFIFVTGNTAEDGAALRDRFGRGGGPSSTAKAEPIKLPPEGFPLPEGAKLLRDKYDTNKDGKLSQEEFDAMPEWLRAQVGQTIRQRLGDSVVPKSTKEPAPREAKEPKDPPKEPKEAAKTAPPAKSTFRLPPGGVAIPEAAKLIREKYDTNKDGKLTQEEFDAIPEEIRAQVEKFLRNRLGEPKKAKD
jgi:hypothetical protein